MKTVIGLAVLLACLQGCATTSVAQLQGLVGKTVNEATMSLKKSPEYHVETADGGIYTWKWSIMTYGGTTYYEVVTAWTDRSGRINRWQRSAE